MERYVFDYRKLNGRIREVFGSQKEYAKALGVSEATVSKKLSNKAYFSQREIEKTVDILGIAPGSITAYFFTM